MANNEINIITQDGNNITVGTSETKIIEVITSGPQGPKGDSGIVDTGSFVLNSQTSSFVVNSQTASFATTGSNIFSGSQTITGSLNISGETNFNNVVAVNDSNLNLTNSSSLNLTSGSNIFIDSGSLVITGSIELSGTFNDGIPKLILTGVTDTVGTLTYNTIVNTLGDTFTITATDGVYELVMDTTTPFTSGYTYIVFSAGLPTPDDTYVYSTHYEYVDNTTIKFYVKKEGSTYGSILTQATIEIRVYN